MGIRVLIVLCRFNELIYEKHWTIPDASNTLHTSLLLLLLYCIEHLLCAWGHEASYGWSQELNSPLSDFESAPKPLTCLHSPSLPTPFPSPSQSNSSFMFLGCRSLSLSILAILYHYFPFSIFFPLPWAWRWGLSITPVVLETQLQCLQHIFIFLLFLLHKRSLEVSSSGQMW